MAARLGLVTAKPVSAAEVEKALQSAKASVLPTAEVIDKQPMTQIHQGQYWCNVCTTGMNSEEILIGHLNGKKHKQRMSRVDASLFTPHQPLGPISGQQRATATKAPSKKSKAAVAAAAPVKLRCETCELDFSGEAPFQAHMAGKKHLKKLSAPSLNAANSRYSCAVCQFVGNSATHLEAHLHGKAHAKKAGLPAPPPGPASTPAKPASEKTRKPYRGGFRFQPYFKQRSAGGHNHDRSHVYSSATDHSQSYQPSQVKSVSQITDSNGANPAAYATGIAGAYGF